MGLDRQLEHELAVLALADLQERALVGGADVVALRVDEEDVGPLAADLAAEDERGGPVGADALPARRGARRATSRLSRPDVERGLEEVVDGRQALVARRC